MHWVWHAGHVGREASYIGFGMPGMSIVKQVALGLAARHADREASCIGLGMPGMPIAKPVALGFGMPGMPGMKLA